MDGMMSLARERRASAVWRPGGDARLSISLSQHYRLRAAARRCARDAASVAGFSFATSS